MSAFVFLYNFIDENIKYQNYADSMIHILFWQFKLKFSLQNRELASEDWSLDEESS